LFARGLFGIDIAILCFSSKGVGLYEYIKPYYYQCHTHMEQCMIVIIILNFVGILFE